MKNLTVTEPNDKHRCIARPEHQVALIQYLLDNGLDTVCLFRRRFPRFPLIQELFLQIMVWGQCLRTEKVECNIGDCYYHKVKRVCLGYSRGKAKAKAFLVSSNKCSLRKELLHLLKDYKPLIVVDLGLIETHQDREFRSLRVQIGASLGVVRKYLWDRHLLVTSIKPGVLEWLRAFMGRGLIDYSSLPGDEAASLRGARQIIILDPLAEEELSSRDVLAADAFVIGGIVDIVPRPGATRQLNLRGLGKPRRIALKGSTIGVPSRIPQIIEIILRARFETCGDVEEAIRRTMSPRDARLRAFIELMKWSRGRRKRVPISLYYELRKWLPISIRDFVRAAKMAKLEITWDKEDQQRPNSS